MLKIIEPKDRVHVSPSINENNPLTKNNKNIVYKIDNISLSL